MGADLDPALCTQLEELGMHVTASGRVTISAEISAADYQTLFHALPGTPARLEDTPELAIPAVLEGVVALITVTPPHVPAASSKKGKDATI